MSQITTVTDNSFEEEVLKSKTPILVDFWASWCPPCKMVEPVVKELTQNISGTVKILKINVDQNPISANKYQITGVPTFIIFKDGKEISRRIGAQSKQQLLDMFKAGEIAI